MVVILGGRMRNLFRCVAALAATMQMIQPTGLSASPTPAPPTTLQQERAISIPFDPPLDQAIRYRRTTTSPSADGPIVFWMDTEYLFQRRAGGFRVQVSTIDVDVDTDNATLRARLRQMLMRLQVPHVLLLDESGAVVGMEEEEVFWRAGSERMRETFRQLRNHTSLGEDASDDMILTIFAAMPRASRLALISQGIRPIIEFASSTFRIGERSEVNRYTASPLPEPVMETVEIVGDRVEDGHLFVTTRAQVTREAMASAIDAFIERILPIFGGQDSQAARERARAVFPERRMRRVTEGWTEVDTRTGLTLRHQSLERLESGTGQESQDQITNTVLETIE